MPVRAGTLGTGARGGWPLFLGVSIIISIIFQCNRTAGLLYRSSAVARSEDIVDIMSVFTHNATTVYVHIKPRTEEPSVDGGRH